MEETMKPITELYETASMMSSENYKERFRAEYAQLKIRYDKLDTMVAKYEDGSLSFTPTCPIGTYQMQLRAMGDYLNILQMRAVMEGIIV